MVEVGKFYGVFTGGGHVFVRLFLFFSFFWSHKTQKKKLSSLGNIEYNECPRNPLHTWSNDGTTLSNASREKNGSVAVRRKVWGHRVQLR